MNTQKISLVLMSVILFSACSKEPSIEVKKFDSLAEAQIAIEKESLKIDSLFADLKKTNSFDEKKNIVCDKIPHQYDILEKMINDNRHLMTAEDKLIEGDFLRLIREQRAELNSLKVCN